VNSEPAPQTTELIIVIRDGVQIARVIFLGEKNVLIGSLAEATSAIQRAATYLATENQHT